MKAVKNSKQTNKSARLAPRNRLISSTTVRAPRFSVSETETPSAEVAKKIESELPRPADAARGDSLHLYLREIGQVKLLTPEEEIALARRIKRGDKQAREHMIKANLRLVVKIARDYEGLGVPLLDLISEGNIGLMKGVEKFDPKKGAKLSTYASLWIKQQIRRALANQSKTIRLPVHVVERMARLRVAESKLRETLDREPTEEELAQELDLDARRIRQYRDASRAPVSLDAPIGDDESNRVAEIVADPNAGLPSDRLVQSNDTELVQEVLSTLPEREKAILALRFGLNDGREKTLEEIGAHFGLTRERIRQIQELALKKMRAKIERRDIAQVEEKASLAIAA
ncbi:MAG: sigma-70 family RNA polymerase sigma factor [Verrucomicrobia bacterium]|nr:MAG: sigma-70 family RNA polymerase sigma factor [Verrucomicrobiota bacterium]